MFDEPSEHRAILVLILDERSGIAIAISPIS